MRLAVLALLLLATGCAREPGTLLEYANAHRARDGRAPLSQAELDARERERQRGEEEHEAIRLRKAGFDPAEVIRRAGRTVVRATFTEPYLAFRMPGVSVERLRDGRVRLTLSSDGRSRAGSALIPAEAWEELRALENAAFAPDPPQVPPGWRRGDPLPPPFEWDGVICHGWGARLERIGPDRAERVSAHGCNNDALTRARLAYAARLADVAVAAFPDCQEQVRSSDPLYRFARCFGRFDPATTDDP